MVTPAPPSPPAVSRETDPDPDWLTGLFRSPAGEEEVVSLLTCDEEATFMSKFFDRVPHWMIECTKGEVHLVWRRSEGRAWYRLSFHPGKEAARTPSAVRIPAPDLLKPSAGRPPLVVMHTALEHIEKARWSTK